MFARASGGTVSKVETVQVGGGRTFTIPRAAGPACWFTFDELCNTPTGAADFAVVAQRYDMIVLSGIPQLSSEHHNQASAINTHQIRVFLNYKEKKKQLLTSTFCGTSLFSGCPALPFLLSFGGVDADSTLHLHTRHV